MAGTEGDYFMAKTEMINVLTIGRTEGYVKKSSAYNPYVPSDIYDWDFKLVCGNYLFTDSYRGFNPYSGVENIYIKNQDEPIWSCDYIGYILENTPVSAEEIYGFLKEGRGNHLLDCVGSLFIDYSYKKEILSIKPSSKIIAKRFYKEKKFITAAH